MACGWLPPSSVAGSADASDSGREDDPSRWSGVIARAYGDGMLYIGIAASCCPWADPQLNEGASGNVHLLSAAVATKFIERPTLGLANDPHGMPGTNVRSGSPTYHASSVRSGPRCSPAFMTDAGDVSNGDSGRSVGLATAPALESITARIKVGGTDFRW